MVVFEGIDKIAKYDDQPGFGKSGTLFNRPVARKKWGSF